MANNDGTSNFNVLVQDVEHAALGWITGQDQSQAVSAGSDVKDLASGVAKVAPGVLHVVDNASDYAIRALCVTAGLVLFLGAALGIVYVIAGGSFGKLAEDGGELARVVLMGVG